MRIKRLVASIRGKTIAQEHLDLPVEPAKGLSQENTLSYEGKTMDEVIADVERRMIGDALKKCHWNKQKTAQELGLSRQGLAKKMRRLGIKG